METKIFNITGGIARSKDIPVWFAAIILKETDRAYYLYGRGTTETRKMGVCCCCGRALTHPVSVLLGIGPECGNHWWDWKAVGGYTEENIENLRGLPETRIIDTWLPKACVKSTLSTEEVVVVSPDHPMLSKDPARSDATRRATYGEYKDTHKPCIQIWFPYNIEDLDRIRTLPGRRFHSEGSAKYWTAPLHVSSIETLVSWGFTLDLRLQEFARGEIDRQSVANQITITQLREDLALYPFQLEGVRYIEAERGRALIGDDMGLGKTCQGLSWLQLHPEVRRVVCVVPATGKYNWEREIGMWTDRRSVQILEGSKPTRPIHAEIVIINYDILPNEYEKYIDLKGRKKQREIERTGWVDYLIDFKPQLVILDECHKIKNNGAQRTLASKKLCKGVPNFLGMSGTPAESKPIELYNALQLVGNPALPTFRNFTARYCDAKHNGFGWDFGGHSNEDELFENLRNWGMIRRKKTEVLPDLPTKVRSVIPLDITNRLEYTRAHKDFIKWVRETSGSEAARKAKNAETLVKIGALKRLAVEGKMDGIIQWIRETLDSTGEKLVVFTKHTDPLNRIMEEFKDIAVKLDGSVSKIQRQVVVDMFQTDPSVRLFVGNMDAAGVLITLTASSKVAFVELGWGPGEHDQAEDRCLRIGSTGEFMNAYYLLAHNTIDEDIADMIDGKRKVVSRVLDGETVEETSKLSFLLDRMIAKERRLV